MPSLALLIGGTTALTVAVVAAVTLSITLAFSLDAVNSLAGDATASLLGLAGEKLDAHIARPRDAVLAVSGFVASGNHVLPTEDPTWGAADILGDASLAAFRAARVVATVAAVYKDGTYIQTQRNPKDADHILQVFNVPRGLGTANATIDHKLRSSYTANGTASPPALLTGVSRPTQLSALFTPGSKFDDFLTQVFVGDNAFSTFVSPPVALQYGTAAPFMQMSVYAAAVNASGVQHGILVSGIAADALSGFLQASKVTAGTELFVVGPDRRVLATTHDAPFYTAHADMPRTLDIPDGCATTLITTAGQPGTPVHWICRQALAESAFAPAAALSGTEADWGLPTPGVHRQTLAGTRYFVGVRRQALERVFGYTLAQVILIPEDDVAGFVREGVAVAVGVTCAVLVVAVALSSLVVVLLLRPLKGVAARMERAAALQADDEDGAGSGTSVIAEVRELQESFDALSAELQRLKSFVPDAVLARQRGDSGSEDDGDNETLSARSRSEHASIRLGASRSLRAGSLPGGSVRGAASTRTEDVTTQSARTSKRRSGAAPAATAALNTLAGLSERNVTVLVLNCAGFNAATRAMPHRAMGELYAQFVAAVVRAVHDHGGVLDAFHGDRVLASFNGARAAAAHARRGVAAAHAIAARAVPATLGLAAHVGVGSGRCRVGNAGCDGARRFSVFGTAVARASALCARAAAYTDHGRAAVYVPSRPLAAAREPVPLGSAVLVSGALFDEIEALFTTTAIDAAFATRADTNATVIAAVLGIVPEAEKGTHDGEWMYVLEGGDGTRGDSANLSPEALLGLGFRAAVEGKSDQVVRCIDDLARVGSAGSVAVDESAVGRLAALRDGLPKMA